jgi:hypothetical protein
MGAVAGCRQQWSYMKLDVDTLVAEGAMSMQRRHPLVTQIVYPTAREEEYVRFKMCSPISLDQEIEAVTAGVY